jgi:hypothetical protein
MRAEGGEGGGGGERTCGGAARDLDPSPHHALRAPHSVVTSLHRFPRDAMALQLSRPAVSRPGGDVRARAGAPSVTASRRKARSNRNGSPSSNGQAVEPAGNESFDILSAFSYGRAFARVLSQRLGESVVDVVATVSTALAEQPQRLQEFQVRPHHALPAHRPPCGHAVPGLHTNPRPCCRPCRPQEDVIAMARKDMGLPAASSSSNSSSNGAGGNSSSAMPGAASGQPQDLQVQPIPAPTGCQPKAACMAELMCRHLEQALCTPFAGAAVPVPPPPPPGAHPPATGHTQPGPRTPPPPPPPRCRRRWSMS